MMRQALFILCSVFICSCAHVVQMMPSTVVAIETPGGEEVLVDNEPVPVERQRQVYGQAFEGDSLFDKLAADRKWAFVSFVNSQPARIALGGNILPIEYKNTYINTMTGHDEPLIRFSFSSPDEIMAWENYSDLEKTYVITRLSDIKQLAPSERRYWNKSYRREQHEYNRQWLSADLAGRPKQLYVTVGIPFYSRFNYVPPIAGRRESRGTIFGINAGAEYFYTKALSVAAGCEYIPWVILHTDEYQPEPQRLSQINLYLTNNTHFWRFSLGYGLNFSADRWRYFYNLTPEFVENNSKYEDYVPEYPFGRDVSQRYWTAGFNFNLNYNIGSVVRFGVVYRPTFWRLNTRYPDVYEHSWSFEVKWLINTRKPFRN